jgi:acetoin utilization protein AcuB
MAEKVAPIKQYMSTGVVTIGAEQPMSVAHRVMREHRIRHLPVLGGGKVVGILTDRDLHLVERLPCVDPVRVGVGEAMTTNPYVVAPEAAVKDVVAMMVAKKHACAIVSDEGRVVGIFTPADACSAFGALLRDRVTA